MIMIYRNCAIEPIHGGYMVELWGDQIVCNTIEEAKEMIDNYLDAD